MKTFFRKVSLVVVIIAGLLLSACTKASPYVRYSESLVSAFTTINRVDFWSEGKLTDKEKTELMTELNNTLRDLDKKFNIQDRGDGVITDLMKVNNNSGIAPVEVDEEVITVLKLAIEVAEKTEVDGVALYDVTIAPIWQLWDFANKTYVPMIGNFAEVPSREDIEDLLPLVDYKKVKIDEENKTIFLEEEGMALDLGSIVKGYAADKLRNVFIKYNIPKAVIDVGRNILVHGSFFDRDNDYQDIPFPASIVTPYVSSFDPNYDKIGFIGDLEIADKTLVTSGIYEKYIRDKAGNDYHHILDPRTGYPFDNEVVSISVITDESIKGDAYSTALLSLGLERGMALVEENMYLDTVWVVRNEDIYEVYISSGLEGNFVFNTNLEEFNYVYKGVYQ
ncbi:MAG TPA: FAD:protein FMN transferase [Acholeplasmataceae bacterium]|nr:FAD:protein FMN transferase [Acholeplasmataceae bacterium]